MNTNIITVVILKQLYYIHVQVHICTHMYMYICVHACTYVYLYVLECSNLHSLSNLNSPFKASLPRPLNVCTYTPVHCTLHVVNF